MHVVTTHTNALTCGLASGGPTLHTPKQAGWSGSAQEQDIAAPLLNPAKGGMRTTDIDGATWVIQK